MSPPPIGHGPGDPDDVESVPVQSTIPGAPPEWDDTTPAVRELRRSRTRQERFEDLEDDVERFRLALQLIAVSMVGIGLLSAVAFVLAVLA